MFAVLRFSKDINLDALGETVTLDLSWADGMIGALPVFDSQEAAEAYAGETGARVVELGEVD